jgi:hypothetical protein
MTLLLFEGVADCSPGDDGRAFEMLGFSGGLFDRLSGDGRFQDLWRRMRLPTADPSLAGHPAHP